MESKLKQEEKMLSKKFMEYIDKKYPNDDDIIPEYEGENFIEKYASPELKKYYKEKEKYFKKGIIID